MKKFGKPSVVSVRYVSGKGVKCVDRVRPLSPVMGKGGEEVVVNPVAQIRTSSCTSFPVSSIILFGVIEVILSDTKSMLSSTKASKYPGPGVRRRHPTAKDGIKAERISGFLESRSDIMVWRAWTASVCIVESWKEMAWIVLPSVSITLRKARSFEGLSENSLRRSSETGGC